MKMQIDTIEKTVTFEEAIELDELFKTMKMIFPDNSWKSYKLIPKTIIGWQNPIIISNPVYPNYPWNPIIISNPVYPNYPWNPPMYMGANPGCVTTEIKVGNSCDQGIQGVYNLEFNN